MEKGGQFVSSEIVYTNCAFIWVVFLLGGPPLNDVWGCPNDPWPQYFCKSIAIQMGAVSWYKLVVYVYVYTHTSFCHQEGILLQNHRDRNGRCIVHRGQGSIWSWNMSFLGNVAQDLLATHLYVSQRITTLAFSRASNDQVRHACNRLLWSCKCRFWQFSQRRPATLAASSTFGWRCKNCTPMILLENRGLILYWLQQDSIS